MKVKISRLRGPILNAAILILVAILLLFTVALVRDKLLQNAQDLGDALVDSYAVEQKLTIQSLTREVDVVSQYVDEILKNGGDYNAIQTWVNGHFSKLLTVMGDGTSSDPLFDFYAVIEGKIVAANPWEGDEDYRYQDTDWYRQALEADGQVVCGEIYTDAVTGQRIFTISKALSSPGDVFALDVYVQSPLFQTTGRALPEDCSYYLCDSSGTLIYAVTRWGLDEEMLQRNVDYILSGIADGSLVDYDASFLDEEGVARGVYYHTMQNGWTILLTIPIDSILMGEKNTVVYIFAGLALVVFLLLSFFTVLDLFRNRRMKRADDTAHMLGDSFYAIYRVNFVEGTFEAFKANEDVQHATPASGPYALLLQAICSLVQPSTFRLFEESFSLDSIRQRVSQGIPDYGGDYQRRFGDVYRWVNIRTLYDPELTPNEVILCFRDVDVEKRRELQNTIILQEALDAAQKSTKAKSEFFSRMSHDMRTPLNAILNYCTLAEKACQCYDNGKLQEYMKKISFSGDQLLSLINDILELSRMEAGKNNLDLKQLDLKELLTNLAEISRDRAQSEEKSLEISIEFRDPIVIGDEKKLGQIINNLLSNAIKYTNPGDRIRLEARQFDFQAHSKYQIIVEDTGIGMSSNFLEHLFDPYSRETAFSAHSTVGTGLGMSIVKSLVQQMSGEISVESTLGEGSCFTVTLPLVAVTGQVSTIQPAADEPKDTFAWSGRTVLLAEDNELNREITGEILRQFGAQVVSACDGLEALQQFQAAPLFSIDVILMDMQMPHMDGCQAAEAIRHLNRADAKGVPIIAVTANAFAEDIDRTTKAGMDDHISKPIDSRVLQKSMQRLISQWDDSRRKLGWVREGEDQG